MQEKYTLEKCNLWDFSITKELFNEYFKQEIYKYSDEDYLYWDKVKYKDFQPPIKNHEELRWIIKFTRATGYFSPVKTPNGEFFKYWELDFSKKLLHEIDKNAGWVFFSNSTETEKKMFIANGTLEEAISSSQLEWASTTTKNAKEMIQKWRKPRNKDEQMILNNYEAMNFIKSDLIKKDLEKEDLLYLQSILTKKTLENVDEEGRWRKDSDNIIVEFQWKVAHVPPDETFLKEQIEEFIKFANNKDKPWNFIHPIIKSIILHFWIGYLHPFCDGNWRTARAIFYWYLLKNEYFWFSYIPLSTAIKKSKIDYSKAYIYSEQDEFDLTYFINYNLRKINLSLEKFKEEVEKKFKETNINLRKLSSLNINERQRKLIDYF